MSLFKIKICNTSTVNEAFATFYVTPSGAIHVAVCSRACNAIYHIKNSTFEWKRKMKSI